MGRMEQVIKRMDDAVSLPVVVKEVIDQSSNPRCDAKALAKIVSKDPVLAAKLLRTANSSLFGFLSKTTEIEQAVVRLGLKQVRSIALALGVGKLFSCPEDQDGYSRINVWKHSVAVGLYNQLICTHSKKRTLRPLSGQALLAGLVHDMGIILCDQHWTDKFKEIPGLVHSLQMPFHQVEQKRFGFDHAMLGAAVMRKWRFPEDVIVGIEHHHSPGKSNGSLLAFLTAMSELLVVKDEVGYNDVPRVPMAAFGKLQTMLGLTGPVLEKVRSSFAEQAPEMLEIFEIGNASKVAPTHELVHRA